MIKGVQKFDISTIMLWFRMLIDIQKMAYPDENDNIFYLF